MLYLIRAYGPAGRNQSILKIGFSDLEKDDIFKLENYCTKWGIKHNKWINPIFLR